MSNIMLGAFIEKLFERPVYSDKTLRTAKFVGNLASVVLWLMAIVGYGLAFGYLSSLPGTMAKVGLVLTGLSILPAGFFVVFLGPEWAQDAVFSRATPLKRE